MFNIEVRSFDGYTRLVCSGPANLGNFKEMFDELVKGSLGSDENKKYLIDLRPIIGTIHTLDRYELGNYMAEKVANYKIAAISKKETYSKVGENVAVNRGGTVFATDDEDQAIEWIVSQ